VRGVQRLQLCRRHMVGDLVHRLTLTECSRRANPKWNSGRFPQDYDQIKRRSRNLIKF
jgi:hypothetical protein